jgi:hypothetical protein
MTAASMNPTRVAVGDLQRNQLDVSLHVQILCRRQQDFQYEGDHHQRRDSGEPACNVRRHPVGDCGEPHVPVTTQRNDHTEHRQPQEQEIGELVGPEQRAIEQVARHDTGEQDTDFGGDQRGADRFARDADRLVNQKGTAPQRRPGGGVLRKRGGAAHDESGPTYFSSSAQALSPAVFFMSG